MTYHVICEDCDSGPLTHIATRERAQSFADAHRRVSAGCEAVRVEAPSDETPRVVCPASVRGDRDE